MKLFTNSNQRWICTALAASAALALLTGCNETNDIGAYDETMKLEIAAAFDKQEQLQSNQFNGELTLSGGDNADRASPQANPFSSILSDGIRWDGILYREPLRLEADVVIGPERPEPQAIPLLIQDNKLYASIPIMNKTNEYVSIDLDDPKQKESIPIDDMLKAGSALDDLAAYLFAEMNPGWIRLHTDSQASEDGADRRYEVTVTEGNAKDLAISVRTGLSKWLESMPAAFLGGLPTTEALTSEEELRLSDGGVISATINADGFVTEVQVNLSFARSTEGAAVDEAGLKYAVTFSELNLSPAITKEIPANVLPLKNILRFLEAGQANK